jgi:hypothetical protein
MSRLCFFLALTGLVLAAPAAQALPERVPVRLVSPQSGATLLAGSEAELEWAPLAPAVQWGGIEEWEAFLSLDGGRTYPIRITPHLDQDLRRVRWWVPGLPTSDARLLLRLGDEHRETAFEMPQRFSISAVAAVPGMEPAFPLATIAPAAGEPALPGHPGVVAWVEGTRRGGSVRQRVAPERLAMRNGFSLPDHHTEPAILTSEEESPTDPLSPAANAASPAPPAGGEARLAGLVRVPLLASDILLLTHRQNE